MFILSRSKWLPFGSPPHLFTRPAAPRLPVPAAGSCLPSPRVGKAGPQRFGVLPTMGLLGTRVSARTYRQVFPPRLSVPVGRYPRIGDHDGLQVEAPVAQIPAEREGRAMARRKW